MQSPLSIGLSDFCHSPGCTLCPLFGRVNRLSSIPPMLRYPAIGRPNFETGCSAVRHWYSGMAGFIEGPQPDRLRFCRSSPSVSVAELLYGGYAIAFASLSALPYRILPPRVMAAGTNVSVGLRAAACQCGIFRNDLSGCRTHPAAFPHFSAIAGRWASLGRKVKPEAPDTVGRRYRAGCVTTGWGPFPGRRGIRWLSRNGGSRRIRCWRRRATDGRI